MAINDVTDEEYELLQAGYRKGDLPEDKAHNKKVIEISKRVLEVNKLSQKTTELAEKMLREEKPNSY